MEYKYWYVNLSTVPKCWNKDVKYFIPSFELFKNIITNLSINIHRTTKINDYIFIIF